MLFIDTWLFLLLCYDVIGMWFDWYIVYWWPCPPFVFDVFCYF